MADNGGEVVFDARAIDMSQFDDAVTEAVAYAEEQKRRARSADARADRLEEADPVQMSLDDINREGDRIAAAIESTILRLRTMVQDGSDRVRLYENARAIALLGIHAPTKGEREAKAELVPHVASLHDAADYASKAIGVAERAINGYGKILDWRTGQLYKVRGQDSERGNR